MLTENKFYKIEGGVRLISMLSEEYNLLCLRFGANKFRRCFQNFPGISPFQADHPPYPPAYPGLPIKFLIEKNLKKTEVRPVGHNLLWTKYYSTII